MSERKDGGPAFPSEDRPIVFQKGHEECAKVLSAGINPGMSLRDWFAGMALQGLITHTVYTNETDPAGIEHLVRDCFQVADAMIKAREGK